MTITTPFVTLWNTIQARIEAQLVAGGDGGSAVVVRYPNAVQDEPSSGLWIAPTLREGGREPAQISSGASHRSRTSGVLFVECHNVLGVGTADLRALAERVRVAFDRWSSSGIQFRPCYLSNGSGGDRVGKWWRITVACPFYADDSS